MRLGEIDLTNPPLKPKFHLCRPDKKVIYPLKDIYNVSLNKKLGRVNELNFTIPSLVERNHELIENPLIEKIKHRYLVKVEHNHQIEYFVFLEQNKNLDENGENISYKLFSLGYLLADKIIRSYEATSKTLTQIGNEILSETNWKIGYVDSYFNIKYRSHEIPSQTVLQAIYELADKFNAVIIWDTVNLNINFYNPSNIGNNKGLKFKEGKYLESFDVNTNSEEVVTRLRVYGKDGLTFRRLSPTGSNFIESYDYYMYPFERDSNGNIIKHSDYLSDGLCIALENYYTILASQQGEFKRLTDMLTAKNDEIQQMEQILSNTESQLKLVMDELDLENSSEGSSSNHGNLVQQRAALESEISRLKTNITRLENEENAIEVQMDALRVNVQLETHLSTNNLLELNNFVIEKEYTNDSIVDEQDLLEDGIKAFEDFREPKVNMTVDITSFLSVLEAQNDWQKLSLGDIVKVESKRLRIGIQAKIIEINYDFDNDNISLTIANEKELKDDYRKLMDLIYAANATSTVVNMDKYKWDMIEEATGVVSQIFNGVIDTIKNNIIAGYQQNIEISERGIIVKSPNNPMDVLVIQNGMLAISNDNQNTWKHAITSKGIVGDVIIGRLLMGTRLIIEDENGVIRLSGSLQEIFDENGVPKVQIGEYESGKYGIRIDNGSFEIVNGLPKNQIDPDAVSNWDSAEQNAKDYMDKMMITINQTIQSVRTDVNDLQEEISEGFRDGIIEEAEAVAIEKYINELTTTKGTLDNQYTSIYADSVLSSTSKTALSTSKTSFNTSYTNLINSINTAISDRRTTPEEKEDVDAKFADYKLKINDLQSKLQAAILEIQTTRANNAQANAISHANSNDTSLRTDLRLSAPLPTSITMNASGITAYSTSDSSKYARLDYRGLYIQNGAIDIRTGTSTNRGVIFDSNGIRGYNTSGSKTFEIDSLGNATFSGSLSGATGTFSGNLSAASGTFSGSLSGASGTFSGNLIAAGGTFSGTLNAVNGSFTGSLSGNSITSASISGGTISGTTITGASITGGTISSNTSINVTTDASIGDNINLGNYNSTGNKQIIFNGVARVIANWYNVTLSFPHLDLSECGGISWGTNAPKAVFG